MLNSKLIIPQKRKEELLNMNPRIPQLYGQVKNHKPGNPMRPVVAFYTCPSYKLAKFLAKWFRNFSFYAASHTVNSSIDLANQLKDLQFPKGSKLFSLDIVSMYTNIPTQKAIVIMIQHLRSAGLHKDVVKEFKELISLCLNQNICSFDRSVFKFKDGLPMGAPLSSMVADIFVNALEVRFLNYSEASNILFYRRYVDDILMVWGGDEGSLTRFFKKLNRCDGNTQFTLEHGTDNGTKINYLDLGIRLIANNEDTYLIPEFEIYRKPGFTGVSIHNSSNHPVVHKYAAFNSHIHRLLSLPLKKDAFDKEVQTIKAIADLNGFNTLKIDRLIKRKKFKLLLREPFSHSPIASNDSGSGKKERFVRIPFIGNPSYKIAREIRKANYTPVFYTLSSSRDLIKLKDALDLEQKSGVYRLECGSCKASYVGQTGRKLYNRLQEHYRAFKNNSPEKSAFASHLIESGHDFSNFSFKLLYSADKGKQMNRLEEFATVSELAAEDMENLNDITATFINPFIRFYCGYPANAV